MANPTCKRCGRSAPGELSRRRLCGDCNTRAMLEAIAQLKAREGPIYQKWLASSQRAIARYSASLEKAAERYQQSLEARRYEASPLGQAEQIVRLAALRSQLDFDPE